MSAGSDALRVTHLSKTFPGTRALRDVSVELEGGRIHALVGGNGSGKSTLIKVLAGVHAGDPGGSVALGDARCASEAVTPGWALAAGLRFVHQELGLFEPLSVAESVFSGLPYPRRRGRIDWRALRREAAATLAQLELDVDPDRAVADLRPVERTLVAIARALRGRAELHGGLLVLDEPTARLPKREVDRLLAALRRYATAGQTILYVSHRLDEVLAIADTITVLRDGRLVASRPAAGLDEPALGRLIVGRALAQAVPREPAPHGDSPLLAVRGLRGGGVHGVELTLARGEVVGLAGLVGSGRTSLLELLFGARRRAAGSVVLDGAPLPGGDIRAAIKRGIAYVPEDRASSSVFASLGLRENLSAAAPERYRRGGWLRTRRERADAAASVARFGIVTPDVDAPLSVLSGGNQQKTVLARWLARRPALLLLDEPTQGVDVGARAEIHAQIDAAVEAGSAVVLVSSDLDELLRLSDRILVLAAGAVVADERREAVDREWLVERIYQATAEGVRA